jgi:hypothetical protein
MAPADAVRNKEEAQKLGIDTTHDWSRAARNNSEQWSPNYRSTQRAMMPSIDASVEHEIYPMNDGRFWTQSDHPHLACFR